MYARYKCWNKILLPFLLNLFLFPFQEDQYARWMAAMRLASKGKSLADSSYQSEVRGIQAFLSLQQPARAPVLNPEHIEINIDDFLAPRFSRKIRGKVRFGLAVVQLLATLGPSFAALWTLTPLSSKPTHSNLIYPRALISII